MTYLLAREYKLPISAIPVVPRHAFHHGDFQVNTGAGISTPSDLEGKRVGTRSWTLTPGILGRGILADEYGVDLNSVTWVLAGEEHLSQAEARLPDNTVRSPGIDLFDALARGEIDAGIAGVNDVRRRSSRRLRRSACGSPATRRSGLREHQGIHRELPSGPGRADHRAGARGAVRIRAEPDP
jgi:4,5-dihydroxyphthalate decarboxylase